MRAVVFLKPLFSMWRYFWLLADTVEQGCEPFSEVFGKEAGEFQPLVESEEWNGNRAYVYVARLRSPRSGV